MGMGKYANERNKRRDEEHVRRETRNSGKETGAEVKVERRTCLATKEGLAHNLEARALFLFGTAARRHRHETRTLRTRKLARRAHARPFASGAWGRAIACRTRQAGSVVEAKGARGTRRGTSTTNEPQATGTRNRHIGRRRIQKVKRRRRTRRLI